MGLLSRIGKEFSGQFGKTVPHHRWGETLGLTREAMSLPQMASVPLSAGALGAGAGAAFGAASGGDPMEGAMQGAGLGALAGGVGIAPLMAKRLVTAIAAALKQTRPDLPDDVILREAERRLQMTPPEKIAEIVGDSSRKMGAQGVPQGQIDDYWKNYRGS